MFFTWLATMYFHFILTFTLLHVGLNQLIISSSHHCGGLLVSWIPPDNCKGPSFVCEPCDMLGHAELLVGCILWHINPCKLFDAKSYSYIYIYIYIYIYDL